MGFLADLGRGLWSYRKTLIVFLIPALASPLLMFKGPGQGGWVVIVMASYWITESLPVAVTSLLPIILFPLLGIMDTDDVCRIYLKDTTMLFFGSMIVAVSIEYRNLHRRIALGILLLMGSRPRWLMLGFMLVTAFLSMWISNTATTAMMVPIVNSVAVQILREKRRNMEKHMGNGVKAIELEVVDDSKHKDEDNNISDDAPAPIESKDSEGHQNPAYSHKGDIVMEDKEDHAPKSTRLDEDRFDVESLSKEDKSMYKGLLLCVAYAATIGGTTTLTGTGTTVAMSGILSELYPESDEITFANWMYFSLPATVISLFICWLWLQFFFLDRSLTGWCKDCSCCSDGKSVNVGDIGHQVIKEEYKALGPLRFDEVGVMIHFVILIFLWMFRDTSLLPNWGGWSVIFPVPGYIGDATVAIIVSMSLFIFPAEVPWCIKKMMGKIDETMTPGPVPAIIDWKVMQRMMPWNIVFLLGGGFALASGCEESGLSEWLADQFASLSGIPPWTLVVILSIVLCLFTEVTSNVATTTIFIPICASLAESICINPLYLVIPCTLACTYAYMLPVATPPNAVVFSYGAVTILDMATAGFFMNVVGIIVDNALINTMGPLVYNVFEYPSWADNSACPVTNVG